MTAPATLTRQHLIDPELCIRCNSCEEHCNTGAIRNNGINYVVEPSLCTDCRDCVPDCPTGAIDHWWPVYPGALHSAEDQFGWDKLPAPAQAVAGTDGSLPADSEPSVSQGRGAPPSAATPVENRYSREQPLHARVLDSVRLTAPDSTSEIRHIVLDVGSDFSFLEGQSVGIIPPGVQATGRRHPMRLYSIASARGGEAGVPGTLALTVKRVLEDHAGQPHHGLCSNHVCDLRPGDTAEVVGPFGASFLMPQAPQASLLMIATGTGIAPMRGMLARRLQLGDAISGQNLLFYGGRTPQELPYCAELSALPRQQLDLNLAFSRLADQPKRYVQDLLRERHDRIAALLADPEGCIYLCGLKGMEAGVEEALAAICAQHGLDWAATRQRFRAECRLHVETY